MSDPTTDDLDAPRPEQELPPLEEGGESVDLSPLMADAPSASGDGAGHGAGPPPTNPDLNAGPDAKPSAGGDGALGDRTLVRFEARPGTLDVTDHPLRYAFGHGQHHGEWRIEAESYQEYLRQKAEEEAILADAERHRSVMEEERALRARAADLRGSLAAKRVEARHATEAIERAEGRVSRATEAISSAREEMAALKGRGSRTYMLLYGLAGAVFIVGDVGLARYTISTALRLKGWEGWAFAVGLALLAFVLKPVYDRLVEDRYHEGDARVFSRFILITSTFVGVFLLMMGSYRADFMQSNVGLEQDDDALDQVEVDLARAERLEQTDRIVDLEDERTTLEQRISERNEAQLTNRAGYWSLVFAQLLFAVAGAICLGLATRNLRDWRHLRRPLAQKLGRATGEDDPQRAGELYRQRLAAEAALEAARDRLRAFEEDQERLEAEVAVLESETDALERLEAARDGFAAAQSDLKEVRKRIYEHLYQTGYAMGAKLPEPEVVTSGDGQAGAVPELGGSTASGRRRHRLYLAVREAVRRAAVPPTDDA